jgi:riboflavin synthase
VFTGIIEGLGTIKTVIRAGGGVQMDIQGDFALENVRVGDSISVSGVCLTVVEVAGNTVRVDVAPETLSKSTLGQTRPGDRVNLERALCLGDRLSGHLVTGHVDGIGTVKARRPVGNAVIFTFGVSEDIARYIVQKGSVAVDGVSLTVNACNARAFEVSIIPHTASITTIGLKNVGSLVNVEADMVGKYIERFTQHAAKGARRPQHSGAMDERVLTKAGFMS